MKKLLLLCILFLVSPFAFTQVITVDPDLYTHEELVTDVLIGESCAEVGNIETQSGEDFGFSPSIGFFENTNPNFPIENGVILATGGVQDAPGPNNDNEWGTGGWPGDPQLFDYIQGLGIDPFLLSYNDATIMEFDFTSMSDSISFNFVFGSNEYGTYQCDYSDAFAFFLENQDTGEIVNMALVPGTDIPIAVTTIRNNAHNGSCSSENEEYFDVFYGGTGEDPDEAPVDLNGHTVLMQAWQYVTPGADYRMKLVVANRNDSSFDSAVFIEGGSFFIGSADLGEDLTIENGTASCGDEEVELSVTQSFNATYTWFIYDDDLGDFVEIPGETSNTLTVTEDGTYKIEVLSGTCLSTDEIVVEFVPLPEPGEPQDIEVCDTYPNDGFAEFMLTDNDADIIDGQDDVFVMYFESFEDAETGDPDDQLLSAYTNTTADTQTIYARLEEEILGCFEIVEFDIIVNPVPEPLIDISNYELCDNDENGTEIFDLTTKTDEILDGLPAASYTVTYYVTEDQAEAGTPAIGTPATFNSAGQTIYARVENNVTGCHLVVDFEIIVNPLPIPGPADTVIFCDLNDDGLATFYLPAAEAQLLNGQTDITVTYYTTPEGAEDGTFDQIDDPEFYVNEETPFQTIYVRLENDITGCYQTSSFLIEVRPVDFIPFALQDFEFCVTAESDIGIPIDLTAQEPFIFEDEDPSDYTVTYHLTQGEAAAGTGAIDNPENYLNVENPQVIWVRLVNNVINCVEIGSFTVQIYLNPEVANAEDIPAYEVCDDLVADGITDTFDLYLKIPEIIGDVEDISISFHDSQEDAENDENPLPLEDYTNTVPYLQTIYVRVEDPETGCVVYTTFELIVNENPPILGAGPLTFCDPDNDGFGEFDLTDADDAITGGDPDLVVSYHDTPENAGSGTLPITGIYNNLAPYVDEVHVRIVNTVTGCITVTTLGLEVLDTPQLIDPDPLIGCDDNGDGIVVFDLTDVEPQVFENYDDTWPDDYTIAYYETQEDADDGIGPIDPANAYPNIDNPQTIYIVVEDIENGCQKQTTVELIINDVPAIFEPDPLELCDYNNPGDGIEEFDLSAAIPQITDGDTSIAVSFHFSQEDADNNENPLPLAYENEVPFAQTVFIRAYQATTGCDTTVQTLTLIVNPLPSPEEPTPLEECDTNQNGFALFDLEEKTDEITNGEADVVITYHETFSQADNGLFPIVDLYENIIPYEQTIYVRAENEITGCHTVVELLLIVSDAPVVPMELDDLVACSEDQEEFAVFNLWEYAFEEIYGDQPQDEFTLTFHITLEDAELGESAIADPEAYPNVENPQQIWYRLEDNETRCGNIGSFFIRVELPPMIADPIEALELCDDDVADGITVFDLTVMNDEITLGQAGMDVQYYENEIDAIEGNEENRIDPATEYTNLVNLQEIYVRVVDADTGCASLGTLLLRVLPNPDINTPEPIALCDENEPGNGSEVFDLTEHEDYIINNEVDVIVTYHTSLEDAELGENAIVDPTDYEMEESPEQTIYVRVEYESTGCYSIVELLLIVNPLPNIGDEEIGDYILCEINHGDTGIFNLIEKRQEILDLFAPDQVDYTVTFHEVAGDEEDGINAIPEFELEDYPNEGINPLTLYYRIEHNTTGCYITGEFNLEIREGATAAEPTAPLTACEDALGSGVATFDLTQLDDTILNGQDPDVYEVTYHETFQQALDGDAIGTPTAYTSPTQTIYARVTNNDNSSQGYCHAIVQVHLEVNPMPEVVLPESYRLCVDEDGNPIMEEFGELSPPVIDTGLDANLYTFVWLLDGSVLFGENGASISVAEAGEYTVIVTDIETGCENQASTTVTISSPPLVYGAETITPAFGNEHAIEAWVTEGLGEYIYRLDDGAYQDEGLFENVSPGVHTVTITDVNGCGSVTIEVGVIDYPLYFTPNNDTYHDTWNIIGISAFDPTAKIYVFDRYGKLLKQLSPNGPGWDGTYNGNPMPSNDYWFKVVYEEDDRQKEFSGHFTLKR